MTSTPLAALTAAVHTCEAQSDGPTLDHLNAVYEAAQDLLNPAQPVEPKPRPVVDREALAAILHDQSAGHEWGSKGCTRAGSGCEKRFLRNADAVMELARPMPDRQTLIEQAAVTLHEEAFEDVAGALVTSFQPEEIARVAIDAVLALLNGTKNPGTV